MPWNAATTITNSSIDEDTNSRRSAVATIKAFSAYQQLFHKEDVMSKIAGYAIKAKKGQEGSGSIGVNYI